MLHSKKVLVTGGAGYIGSHTVVALSQAGYEPIILDNFSNSSATVIAALEDILGKPIKYYQKDCCDIKAVREVFVKESIDGIIHFAASKAVGESVEKPLQYYDNNINSLLVILKLVKEFGVNHLVFSSSCTIYGQPEKIPVTEETVSQPAASPYGNTKKICEDILKDVVVSKAGVKIVSLRYFNPIGAHSSSKIGELPIGTPGNLIPYLTQVAAGLRDKLTVFGHDYNTIDGTCVRDYIHVTDLSDAHVKALQFLERDQTTDLYDVFNLGTGAGTSVMEIINSFEGITGITLNYALGDRRPGDIEQIYASVDKARSALRWQASLGINEALMDAWNWQKSLTNGYE